ncbi:MAG: capsule assembly Wzi family protein [Muribaculum sp.]|nr:capsule assembly Wzi family protein [Muribaculum sp.]
MNKYPKLLLIISLMLGAPSMKGELPLDYEISFTAGAGEGQFAPFYISSLRHGKLTQQYNAQVEGAVFKKLDMNEKFSYSFGLDVIGGYASKVDYEQYSRSDGWFKHGVGPSSIWLQQLYGEMKYRSLFVSVGVKERESPLLNQSLTSGDLIESGNSRPIPQGRVGLIDFRDLPLTNGWVQIQGTFGYGRYFDYGWRKKHYNYYNNSIEEGEWYNYKRCYFRTKPEKPFSVTIGMQAIAQFGGVQRFYSRGLLAKTNYYTANIKTFFKMLFPTQDGGEGFYTGDHLGSWDMRARYRLRNNDELFAYFSWLWTDGSGIGKLNGWDGMWGLEYKSGQRRIITGALVEYLDFTNQSGPLHYAPADNVGGTIKDHASGSDSYYNNGFHGSYAYYGMAVGSPMFMSPLYNLDGEPIYVANMFRGIHVGVEGAVGEDVDYRIKGGYRKAWGMGGIIMPNPIHTSAIMLEAVWRVKKVKGLTVTGQMEIDRGDMPCNAMGGTISIKYNGNLNLFK